MAKSLKENNIEVQRGPSLNPDMKTMKTMTQDEKLAEKHEQNIRLKSSQTLTTHMPKK